VASYSILIKRSAARELERLPDRMRREVASRIAPLGDQPRPPGCEKLTSEDLYRICQSDYRIVYSILDAELVVHAIRVANRRDVYR
jgi:mRNA interferase RelE/StbE